MRASLAPVTGARAAVCAAIYALLSVAVLSVPARARAADAVVLSAGGPGGLADEARIAAIDALAADGVAVVPDAEVALRIAPARLRAVAGIEQARGIAFELEARSAVVIAVWPREGVEPPQAESVVISLFIGSRSFSATEAVGEAGLTGAVAAAVRAVRSQQTQAMLADPDLGSGTGAGAGSGAGAASGPGAPEEAPPSGAPFYDIIGPTMLLAFGAAGIGLGAYALLDGTCERRGAMGTCLRGEDPNVPAGATLVVAGGLALVGAVIWFITGASVGSDQTRIDIVLGPEGGAVGARGQF